MFDVNKIRNDFPMFSNNPNLIYFDSAATSFKPQVVIDTVNDYYTNTNTSIHRGDYNLSHLISSKYDDTRNVVKEFINADSNLEIVFTSGATASLNLVAYGYALKHLKKDDVILTSYLEHASNILPWFKVAKVTGAIIKYIPLNEDGTFNIEEYKKCFIDNKVKIVAITHVSNVLGFVNPIKEICSIAHENGTIVSVDGAQSVPHLKIDVKDMDIDFLSFSSHKMCGPAGIGVLYGKLDLLKKMDPINLGGGANARFDKDGNVTLKEVPEVFEAGTPNIEGVLGLASAIKYLESFGMDNIEEYCKQLSEYFFEQLSKLDNVKIYNKGSQNGIVTFNVKGIFAQDAASYFNANNIAVRTGNHCAKILNNIIKTNETIRASMYFYNTKDEIDYFINIIKQTTLEKCVESIL